MVTYTQSTMDSMLSALSPADSANLRVALGAHASSTEEIASTTVSDPISGVVTAEITLASGRKITAQFQGQTQQI